VAFDEGALTGKWTREHTFSQGDFRQNYFAGDRLGRTVDRVEQIKPDATALEMDMPTLALKFSLGHPAVSNVIPGMRNVRQAEMNCGVSDLRDLTEPELVQLRRHRWNRAFWYGGK
jgi:aryl-alcohol dehydrogenase-like predicted oxidoreductase